MRVAGILAASGWRWTLPGQSYLRGLGGEPLLVRAARTLLEVSDELAVVVPPGIVAPTRAALRAAELEGGVIAAGPERWRTMREVVTDLGPSDVVVVHDVLRPLASRELFGRVLTEASGSGAAACAVPVSSTIAEVDGSGRVVRVASAAPLVAVQTPQAFVTGLLQDGLDAVATTIAHLGVPPHDEHPAVQLAGGLVQLVEGDPDNRELVTDDDFAWAESFLARTSTARAS